MTRWSSSLTPVIHTLYGYHLAKKDLPVFQLQPLSSFEFCMACFTAQKGELWLDWIDNGSGVCVGVCVCVCVVEGGGRLHVGAVDKMQLIHTLFLHVCLFRPFTVHMIELWIFWIEIWLVLSSEWVPAFVCCTWSFSLNHCPTIEV